MVGELHRNALLQYCPDVFALLLGALSLVTFSPRGGKGGTTVLFSYSVPPALTGIDRGGKQLTVHGRGQEDHHEDQRGESML